MLVKMLQNWKGEITIDDKRYTSVQDAESAFKTLSDHTHILLHTANKNAVQTLTERTEHEFRITVKKYMTEHASPSFDFMAKWNNDIPMPLRTMTGVIEKETRGMIYMKLHGHAEPVIRCMRCGRTLTNPISQKYGIGPECITKIPIIMNLDINDVDSIKRKLVEVEWSGWIIKSAIIERIEI